MQDNNNMNPLVSPLLTDLYQLTMTYAYWKNGTYNHNAVFDLFFRKNPFRGEYTVFAGLEEALKFIENFKFTTEEIDFLKTMPQFEHAEPQFFEWLGQLTCADMKIYAMKEGTICFPRVPLLRIEGPLAVGQLLETTLLCLINFSTLVATNAARFRYAAGAEKRLLEFGLRRAQGPDGGMSASRYSYVGGFDGTSNVLAAKMLGIPCSGTHAHAFVSSFTGMRDLVLETIVTPKGEQTDLKGQALEMRKKLKWEHTNEGELAAFIAYAQAFPKGFLALVDTYDTLCSGVRNFLVVAYALHCIGWKAVGIRLDSGDLAYLSNECRRQFKEFADFTGVAEFENFQIVASNDINEPTLLSLRQQRHSIDAFGIGTNLVTCQAQPALGAVYKLVEVNNSQRIKLSQEIAKVTIPGRKDSYRLFGQSGAPLLDMMCPVDSPGPTVDKKVLCRHPFEESKRAFVRPASVVPLLQLYWDGGLTKEWTDNRPVLKQIRTYVQDQLKVMREDHLRPINPTPYKVSVSADLYDHLHQMWMQEAPITEMS